MSEMSGQTTGRRGGQGPAALQELSQTPARSDEYPIMVNGFVKFRFWDETVPGHARDNEYACTFDGRKLDLKNGVWYVLPRGFFENIKDAVHVVQMQNQLPAADPRPGEAYAETRGTTVPSFRIEVATPTEREIRDAVTEFGVQKQS